MIRDFIASLMSMFIVEPMQTEMNRLLQQVGAPPAIVRQVTACATAAAPALADKAMGDWWWGATTVAGVWIGTTRPENVLVEVAPTCGAAIGAARPFLNAIRA